MDIVEQEKLLKSLEEEEKTILSELSEIARKNPKTEGHFEVPYPEEGKEKDDNYNEIVEFEREFALKESLEKRLNDIRATIEKLKNGTYGQCENCSVKISPQRLKAMPTANLCINCAKISTREV